MNEIERIDQIEALHSEILGAVRMTIDKVIEIGGLLADQKADLRHGEWLPWAEKHLPFDIRTAQNYMRAHRRRDELKNESVSFLTEAYRANSKPRDDFEGMTPNDVYGQLLEMLHIDAYRRARAMIALEWLLENGLYTREQLEEDGIIDELLPAIRQTEGKYRRSLKRHLTKMGYDCKKETSEWWKRLESQGEEITV